MKTEYFAPFLAEYSCFYIDLLFVILPALGAISFSLGIKWLLDKDKMVMTYVFGKNKK